MLSKNHEIKQKHREIKGKTVENLLYIEELPAENKQKQGILLPFLKIPPAALDDCAAVEFQCRRYN